MSSSGVRRLDWSVRTAPCPYELDYGVTSGCRRLQVKKLDSEPDDSVSVRSWTLDLQGHRKRQYQMEIQVGP